VPLSGIRASISGLSVRSITDAQTTKCHWSSLIVEFSNDSRQRHTEKNPPMLRNSRKVRRTDPCIGHHRATHYNVERVILRQSRPAFSPVDDDCFYFEVQNCYTPKCHWE
jgi:hypothetical protein